MKSFYVLAACLVVGCAADPTSEGTTNASADTVTPDSPLARATQIAGHYIGESTAYRVDANGDVVVAYTFHEDITATNPELKDGRAFVHVTDVITGTTPQSWTEGFLVNADGSVGSRYFLMDKPGSTDVIEVPIANGGATFQTEFYVGEENALGFGGKDIVYKKHTTVKNTITSGNVETDVISRVTTVSWKEADGTTQTKSFVSMNGYQSRTLATK
jgi:hypothetical protein